MESLLNRLRRRLQPITGHIDATWSNDYMLGVRGWLVHRYGDLRSAEIKVGDTTVPITDWHPRPDVAEKFGFKHSENCGFWVQVPRLTEHRITISATDGQRDGVLHFTVQGQPPPLLDDEQRAGELFEKFIDIVNREHLHVLEIGSRVVAPGSKSKRELFSGAASYTGFDYYPDDNTDVLGDAHRLAEYFPERRFGAVFSYSVLEHLAMPWVVSAQINQVMTLGGYTYHHTHFAWPLHERPWDFWRFSDEGLKVLFSPPLGFEVLGAGLFEPLRMQFDRAVAGMAQLPCFPAYGGTAVLARKTHNVDTQRLHWDTQIEEVCGPDMHYPDKTKK